MNILLALGYLPLVICIWFLARRVGIVRAEGAAKAKAAYERALDFIIKQLQPSGFEMGIADMKVPIYRPVAIFQPKRTFRACNYTIYKPDGSVQDSRSLEHECVLMSGDVLYMNVGMQ